jgi:sugar lactone lactonase YvrE
MRHAHLLPLVAALLVACADGATEPQPFATETNLSSPASNAAESQTSPAVIALPRGFSPEGIAFGRGSTFYVGSIPSGAIFRGDAVAGTGSVLVSARPGRQASGLKVDEHDRLFVAGGLMGQAYVYDAASDSSLAVYDLTPAYTGLVNDVVLTRNAAYFTDSFRPVLYRLPLPSSGALPAPSAVREIPLSGAFTTVPEQINGNGIVATSGGKHLILVNSATGLLFRVHPATGHTTTIELGDSLLLGGDGLLLDGQDLYVVQGIFDQIKVVRLDAELTSGRVVRTITSTSFDFPSTIAEFAGSLYVVNARFKDAPPPCSWPNVNFDVVRVPKP